MNQRKYAKVGGASRRKAGEKTLRGRRLPGTAGRMKPEWGTVGRGSSVGAGAGRSGFGGSIHVGVEKGREGSGLEGSVHVGVEKGREGSGLGGSVHVGVEKKRDGEASGGE